MEDVIDASEGDAAVLTASESSDDEPSSQVTLDSQPAASASASTSKKKKKKKSKAARALAALRPQGAIPQSLVDQVVEKVKAEHGEGAPGTDEAHVRMALEQLKVGDVIKGKAGIGGKNRKEMGEHKVRQPDASLTLFNADTIVLGDTTSTSTGFALIFQCLIPFTRCLAGEGPPLDDGYIEPSKPREEVRQDPYPLPKDFQWCVVDLNDQAQLKEVYELLSANYVEDDAAAFRFQYTAEFLEW